MTKWGKNIYASVFLGLLTWATWRVRKADAGEWRANCFLASLRRALLSAAAPPGTPCASACHPCRFFPWWYYCLAPLISVLIGWSSGKERQTHQVEGSWLRQVGRGWTADAKPGKKKKNPGLIQYHTWISVWKALHHSAPRGAENRGWMLCLDHVPSEVSGQFHWNAPSTVQKCIRVDIDSVTLTVSVSMSHSLNMFVQVMWSLTSLPAW